MQKNYPKGMMYTTVRQLFGDGLVTAEGEKWKLHRKMMHSG